MSESSVSSPGRVGEPRPGDHHPMFDAWLEAWAFGFPSIFENLGMPWFNAHPVQCKSFFRLLG